MPGFESNRESRRLERWRGRCASSVGSFNLIFLVEMMILSLEPRKLNICAEGSTATKGQRGVQLLFGTVLPSGAPFCSLLWEGFPFKLNQPKKDALFSRSLSCLHDWCFFCPRAETFRGVCPVLQHTQPQLFHTTASEVASVAWNLAIKTSLLAYRRRGWTTINGTSLHVVLFFGSVNC